MEEEKEPVIHSHITDILPDDHPLAFETVYCDAKREHKCNDMLHCSNNECMTTWVEFAGKNVCMEIFACFILENADGVLDESKFLEYISTPPSSWMGRYYAIINSTLPGTSGWSGRNNPESSEPSARHHPCGGVGLFDSPNQRSLK